jgi:hypothetical protein
MSNIDRAYDIETNEKHFKRKEKQKLDGIIKCPKCQSEIAVDRKTVYSIDCDCGAIISYRQAKKQLTS